MTLIQKNQLTDKQEKEPSSKEIQLRKKDSLPNLWKAQENLIHFYKKAVIVLTTAVFAQFIFIGVSSFRDPPMIVRSKEKTEFYPVMRDKAELQKSDVADFVKNYLASLYTWDHFDLAAIELEISPYTTKELVPKILSAQSDKVSKLLNAKILAQGLSFVKVEVMDDRVVCHFDRILKIENVPLVVPTELTLYLQKGSSTRVNPSGVYVSGISEFEGDK